MKAVKDFLTRAETKQAWLCLVLVLVVFTRNTIGQEVSDINNQATTLDSSLTQPVIITEGQDALLTCVAKNLGEHTVLWKYGQDKILTAGSTRITADKRLSVLHDEGGDVYVLSIRDATHTDTGLYICEVNTDPPARSFHKLTVLADKLVAPPNNPDQAENNSASIALWGFSTPAPIDHDYTECCVNEGVTQDCLGFCSIKNILEGTTGNHPSNCDNQFKKIVHCMADGKNHVPCCQRAQVPDVCQDMCIGEYTEQTEDVRTHISCSAYTAPTLACIAEGVNILPSRPTEVEATTVTDKSMTIEWTLPPNTQSNPDRFYLNITKARKFTPEHEDEDGSSLTTTQDDEYNSTKTYTIPGEKRSFTTFNLEPFTYYTIVLTSENIHGLSLPSYKLKVLTLSTKEAENQGEDKRKKPARTPSLPDVKQCCIDGKVTHDSCIDTFCDPLSAKKATIPDLMICAPWSQTMFGCLADGKDHSDCCTSRGVPDICGPICSGNATSVTFRHFKCMEYMHDISNCVLRGYGVLPSEPRNFRFSNVGHNVGLLHWDKPLQLADTVASYRVSYIRIVPNEPSTTVEIDDIKGTTYILEDLIPNSSYEVFVEAVNAHGIGDPSTRIVFRTANPPKTENKFTGYDQAFCCKTIGVRDDCMPMCAYNATMSVLTQLTPTCGDEFAKITKCAAGGRDHLPCCTRRGVSEECHAICQGLQYDPSSSIYTTCASYIGNIMMCLEEGVDKLPEPVTEFHASFVSDSEVELAWEPVHMKDEDEQVDHYEIYFKELKNNSDSGSPFDHESNINTTTPMFTVSGLKTNTKYRFFVIARNAYGTSLPSSVVTVNVSKDAWDGTRIEGLPSSPHAIEITQTGADFLTLSWTAPTISHHQDEHKYRLYYSVATNATKDSLITVETSATSVQLKNLTPNTPYVIYLTAVGAKGESEPSETVVTWTEPIVPAFAEAPAVHPRTGLVEGGSMTILCIALGTPTPRITLYLGGHPIRSDTTRHLVTTIYNVTKDMSEISCYADNGYGTPMQTSRSIEIEHKPYVRGPTQSRIVRYVGQDLTVMCTVDALPAPVMSMGRIGGSGGTSLTEDRIKMATQLPQENAEHKYAVVMTITDLKMEDAGSYFCKGNNTHGDETQDFQIVVVDGSHKDTDVMSCCKEQNVTEGCLSICSTHQLDLDLLLYSPQCIPELDKLMTCGSDGSDHRHCCSNSGVPRSCLDWCRGQPVEETEPCALSFAPQIVKCFHEGQYTLPGPPRNIKVTPMDAHSALASWDPPNKNPEYVELYRILWRKEGARLAKKIDTSETSINIDELIPGVTYELVIKAGNSNGTSQLTPPIKFITADKYIIEAKVYNQTPSIIGALVAVLLLLLLIGAGVWYFRGNKTIILRNFLNSSNDRSFTNPFYNQEVTMSHLQQDQVEVPNGHVDIGSGNQLDPIPEQPEQGEQRSVLSRFGLQVPGFAFQRFQ